MLARPLLLCKDIPPQSINQVHSPVFRGPDLDEDEEEKPEGAGADAGAGGSGDTGQKKEKTPQQRAGEAMAKYILEKTSGASYSFRWEAVRA